MYRDELQMFKIQVSSEITDEFTENGSSSNIIQRGNNLEDPPSGSMEGETI